MHKVSTLVTGLAISTLLGCGKPKPTGAPADPAATTTVASSQVATASSSTIVSFDDYGLEADAPPGTVAKADFTGVHSLVDGPRITGIFKRAEPKDPITLANALARARIYQPKHLRSETLADGWVVLWEDSSGAAAWSRRQIAGRAYICDVTAAPEPSQRDAAVAAFKMLRPKSAVAQAAK